ncbi:MAG TPA: hypothetical protein PKA88_22855, partial [Polyangiaceae bacterium]|nr:hypothetical protein [Polyangiaceae bacterium]
GGGGGELAGCDLCPRGGPSSGIPKGLERVGDPPPRGQKEKTQSRTEQAQRRRTQSAAPALRQPSPKVV